MFFELKFKLWDEVDVDTIVMQKRPVGKMYIKVNKLTKPARWKQLWLEDSPKPMMMKLWWDRHVAHLYTLNEFEGDDIDEFEGWNIGDDDEDDEEEEQQGDDMTWLFPEKGPGKFKDLAEKKKKKRKKGKKGRKGKN